MNTYTVTIKVVLDMAAVDQETAVALAEDAAKRLQFYREHRMVSVREYEQMADKDSRIYGMTGSGR